MERKLLQIAVAIAGGATHSAHLDHDPIRSSHDLISLFEYDLLGKSVPTLR